MAWFWLPETVHRTPRRRRAAVSQRRRRMLQRPGLRRMLVIDFVYWFAFAVFQTTFALFVARRFGFDAPQTGYFFAAFGLLGAVVQGAHPADRRPARATSRPSWLGLVCTAIGLVAATLTHSVPLFALTLVPLALGIGFGHPTMSSLVSRAAAGTNRDASRARPARSRASAARSARCGAAPRCSASATACRICPPRASW